MAEKKNGIYEAHSKGRLVVPCVSFLSLPSSHSWPRHRPKEAMFICKKAFASIYPCPKVPSLLYLQIDTGIPQSPSVHTSLTILHTLGHFSHFLIYFSFSYILLYNNYPKFNDIKQPTFFFPTHALCRSEFREGMVGWLVIAPGCLGLKLGRSEWQELEISRSFLIHICLLPGPD